MARAKSQQQAPITEKAFQPRTETLVLAWLLKELSPNARCHWSTKAGLVQQYRLHAKIVARQHLGFRPLTLRPPVHAVVTFLMPDRRRRDRDNMLAAFKPAWDGFQDAGLIEDDSTDKLSITIGATYAGKPGGVRVVLTEAQPAEGE
ncbi:hypothetical protein LCGC14_0935380 [marine sediment metagenome]|uniref:Uncharacterized protein n=1 Tax=marine sediment metagenome TaxID=412755 RepID=A0A0F9P7U9_9ZZZZ